MNYNDVLEQFNELQSRYPLLRINSKDKNVEIRGNITVRGEYNNTPLIDDYNILIVVKENYPFELPNVYDLSSKVPKKFKHFLIDGAFCLGVKTEIISDFKTNPTLLYFVDRYICNYLYIVTYFNRFGVFPFGERAHGIEGIIDYYKEVFNLEDSLQVNRLLELVVTKRFRGHILCPCGSNKKIRQCDHGSIVLDMINSDIWDCYNNDYNKIKGKIKNG